MNKVLLILMSAAFIFSAVSCTDGGLTTEDSSKSIDTAAIATDDYGNHEDRVTEDETWNITGELDSDEHDESGWENNDTAVTKAPDKMPEITYEDYINMTPQQQADFIKSFSSVGKFTEWYNAAKVKYDKNNDKIYVGDESINLGDIFKK